jgi:hypothetical protein
MKATTHAPWARPPCLHHSDHAAAPHITLQSYVMWDALSEARASVILYLIGLLPLLRH